ncbi:MAG: glycosyltransferase family 2 protein [Opitutales bacterium]|nr:glycosyltransferase family 2 protein [Opitutales bacterium]
MKTPVTIVIPTYNAGEKFRECAENISMQTANIEQVLIIDSQSEDSTVQICKDFGFTVEVISKKDFGHGKTRQYTLEKVNTNIVVFMTQDALLADEEAVEILINCLESDEQISAVYGRQLPYPNTGIIGAFARLNNYPSISFVNAFDDRKTKGIKTAFLSDSFAAYKKDILLEIGGFPKKVTFGEDMYVAGKMLMKDYKTAYCSEAKVYHSHDYNLKEEFDRCVEIGRFHKQEHWLLDTFGKAEGEGLNFVVNEAKYLLKNGKWYYLPVAFSHNVAKFLGYKLGFLF